MERSINNVLIIVNTLKPDADTMVEEIKGYLEKQNIGVCVKKVTNEHEDCDYQEFDLAFSLGGDGTVLYSSRLLSELQIPIMAVNLGDFGFITEVSQSEWKEAFLKYQRGLLGISKRIMLDVSVTRNGAELNSFTGLNDGVIGATGISKIVRLQISLSDTYVGGYRADGVIVSSPTGSTAYSAAAGGPILDPEMEAMIINPICPFTLSNRPIVVPGDKNIIIEVMEKQRTDILLTVDGQYAVELLPRDTIHIGLSEKRALIIRSDRRNFYEVLRTKLNWSGGPDA